MAHGMKQLSRKSTLPNVNEQKHLEACIIRSGCIPFDERVAVCSQRYQTLMASQSQAEYNNSSTTAICSTEDVSLVMTISCVISITHCFEEKKRESGQNCCLWFRQREGGKQRSAVIGVFRCIKIHLEREV